MPGRFYPGVGPYRGRHVNFTGYEFDEASIARCAVGPELRHAIGELTDRARGYAASLATELDDQYRPNVSLSVDVLVVPDIPYRRRGEPMARWSGRVVNSANRAILMEVGSDHTPAQRILGRTLDWLELVAND